MRQQSLFTIIHSLSKAEKRYISLQAKRFSSKGQQKALEIYNTIVKYDLWDNSSLLAKMKKRLSRERLAVEKNNLFKLILTALSDYYNGDLIEVQLTRKLRDINILWIKGLIDQSYRLLQQCQQQAREHQLIPLLIYMLRFEGRIVGKLPLKREERHHRTIQLIDEVQQLIQSLKQSNYLSSLIAHSKFLQNTYHEWDKRRIEAFQELLIDLDHPMLQFEKDRFNERYAIEKIRYHAAFAKADVQAIGQSLQAIQQLLDGESTYANNHITSSYANLISLQIYQQLHFVQDYKLPPYELWKQLLELRNSINPKVDQNAFTNKDTLNACSWTLIYYIHRQDLEKANDLAAYLVDHHTQFTLTDNYDKSLIYFSLSLYCYFIKRDVHQSLKFIKEAMEFLEAIGTVPQPSLLTWRLLLASEQQGLPAFQKAGSQLMACLQAIKHPMKWETWLAETFQTKNIDLSSLKNMQEQFTACTASPISAIYIPYNQWFQLVKLPSSHG